ncbi:MAG: hypothetical protein RL722_1679 [Pseudomonadota bacterium]|jgi:hypothetical protein
MPTTTLLHAPRPAGLAALAAAITAAWVATFSPPTLAAAPAGCSASSGPDKAALVELYTSEGCSSCPGADKQLSQLRGAVDADARIVPIALHVPYWDDIGWKDPYAQPGFAVRQRALVAANARRSVYTPQFFVSGSEARDWPGNIREQVRRVNMQKAALTLDVSVSPAAGAAAGVPAGPGGPRLLTLRTTVQARQAQMAGSELTLALTENSLVSQVLRGENSGVTLHHDHVVRAWIGPITLPALAAGESVDVSKTVALLPGWQRDQLAVVAFAQLPQQGMVLQALHAPLNGACLAAAS